MSTIAGTVNITANASDNVGISSVTFYEDGVEICTDTTAPYSCSWNTLSVFNSERTLSAIARDAGGNTGATGLYVGTNAPSPNIAVTVHNASATVPQPVGPDGYTYCAGETGLCRFSGTKSVAFGAGTAFKYLGLTNGTYCNNDIFGDPAPGVHKNCFVQAQSPLTSPLPLPTYEHEFE